MMDDTQERILRAASAQFMQYGYTAMSLDELAKSLAISKKTIYKFYSGKAALMDAVVEAFFAELNRQLESCIASELPYTEKLQSFLKIVSTAIAQASQNLLVDLANTIPEVWSKILQLRQQTIEAQASRLIQIGIEEGYVRPETNLELFLLVLEASLERATDPKRLIQTGQSFDIVFDELLQMLFRGIMLR